MASALDIFLVTLKGTLFGQLTNNVFAYTLTSGGGSGAPLSSLLAVQFQSTVLGAILPIVSVEQTFQEIYVENVDDVTDFYTDPIINSGEVAGACEPPFVAWGFRLIRSTRLSNNGSKRIPGVPSASIADNEAVSGVLFALHAFSDAYSQNISMIEGTFSPVIYRRPSTVHPSGLGFLSTGAEYTGISSQDSRKVGRGR